MVIETGGFSHRRCVVNAEYKYPTPIRDGHITYSHKPCAYSLSAKQWFANGQLKCPTLDETIYKVYDKYATQMVTISKLKPHVSLAHELRNYL